MTVGWTGVANPPIYDVEKLLKGSGGFEGDYSELKTKYNEKNGFEKHWDTVTNLPWMYNNKTQTFVSYEDEKSFK